MNTIKLNKRDIIDKMWDNCNGKHVIAVAPDGSDYKIHWMEYNRQRNPWPDGWITIGIPAIDPDGSGAASEDAQDMLSYLNLRGQAEALIESDDIGWVEAAERLAPEDWKEDREEAANLLAEVFLNACNGDGADLNELSPWGYRYEEYDEPAEIDPPAKFEWESVDDSN